MRTGVLDERLKPTPDSNTKKPEPPQQKVVPLKTPPEHTDVSLESDSARKERDPSENISGNYQGQVDCELEADSEASIEGDAEVDIDSEADTFADIDAESDAEMRTGVLDTRLKPSGPDSPTKKPDPPPQRQVPLKTPPEHTDVSKESDKARKKNRSDDEDISGSYLG